LAISFSVKKKDQTYPQKPLLFLQPMLIGEGRFVPVESDLERVCIEALCTKYSHFAYYKPLSLDKRVYWQHLYSFLENDSSLLVAVHKAFKEFKENNPDSPPVRPDLLVRAGGNLVIVEIAGFLQMDDYCEHLEQKEREFYSFFEQHPNILYKRIEEPEDLKVVGDFLMGRIEKSQI
jgi:hypothetical protein